MIGVVAKAEHVQSAAEFFELFKTPWEFAVPGRKYRVVLSTVDVADTYEADVVLAFGSAHRTSDHRTGVSVRHVDGIVEIEWVDSTLPIYTGAAIFEGQKAPGILKAGGHIDYLHQSGHVTTWRIGYDLFSEVNFLLTQGQPSTASLKPALELHIALLRQLLTLSGVSFVEIPPRPDPYDFVCCLTHDVDFFGIKRHRFDRTLAGFVFRGTVGTFVGLIRGRRTIGEALRNWLAVLSLPFVFAGLVRDWWQPFDDYSAVDADRGSTYFLAPFKDTPGVSPNGTTDPVRALPYAVSDIRQDIARARMPRTEFAIHGIDAWRDVEAGKTEIEQMANATGALRVGVRMHWLYFSTDSSKRLEAAGFDYDSTCGYNDAVGFRAGTSQAFLPPGASTLMELPFLIMDSAMFFSDRMGLTSRRALELCRLIIDEAKRFGGTVVINWHDRSLAPERLWNRSYRELLNEVESAGDVWFATATEAVDWYRWRRSICFRSDLASNEVVIETAVPKSALPGGRIAIHRANRSEPNVEERRVVAGDTVHLTL